MRNIVKSNRADSSLVSTIILIPLLLIVLVSIVDMGFYFSARAQYQNLARDAARTVAIYGGNGTATQMTPIEAKYGLTKASACAGVKDGLPADTPFDAADYTAVECNLMKAALNTRGVVMIELAVIKDNKSGKMANCSPVQTSSIGQSVSCELGWNYTPLPLSGMNFLMDNDVWTKNHKSAPLSNNVSHGESAAETDTFNYQGLVDR